MIRWARRAPHDPPSRKSEIGGRKSEHEPKPFRTSPAGVLSLAGERGPPVAATSVRAPNCQGANSPFRFYAQVVEMSRVVIYYLFHAGSHERAGPMLAARHTGRDARCGTFGTEHSVLGTPYSVLGTWYGVRRRTPRYSPRAEYRAIVPVATLSAAGRLPTTLPLRNAAPSRSPIGWNGV
jgi:hypothetical protein